jgi:hypothetical protein
MGLQLAWGPAPIHGCQRERHEKDRGSPRCLPQDLQVRHCLRGPIQHSTHQKSVGAPPWPKDLCARLCRLFLVNGAIGGAHTTVAQ